MTAAAVARRNIDSSKLSLDVSRSQTLPNLALTAGYRLTGQGGTQRRIGNQPAFGPGDQPGFRIFSRIQ